ncbi:hypothetical protein [Baekduia soli]|uniref:hypothetical protein n=1 Tax=Baekduia soli TaxID=496014 RepID=UPI001651D206|nr:hypothetical protein [Baekduia soli]
MTQHAYFSDDDEPDEPAAAAAPGLQTVVLHLLEERALCGSNTATPSPTEVHDD